MFQQDILGHSTAGLFSEGDHRADFLTEDVVGDSNGHGFRYPRMGIQRVLDIRGRDLSDLCQRDSKRYDQSCVAYIFSSPDDDVFH